MTAAKKPLYLSRSRDIFFLSQHRSSHFVEASALLQTSGRQYFWRAVCHVLTVEIVSMDYSGFETRDRTTGSRLAETFSRTTSRACIRSIRTLPNCSFRAGRQTIFSRTFNMERTWTTSRILKERNRAFHQGKTNTCMEYVQSPGLVTAVCNAIAKEINCSRMSPKSSLGLLVRTAKFITSNADTLRARGYFPDCISATCEALIDEALSHVADLVVNF